MPRTRSINARSSSVIRFASPKAWKTSLSAPMTRLVGAGQAAPIMRQFILASAGDPGYARVSEIKTVGANWNESPAVPAWTDSLGG